jgi:thymidylate synthase (FAD)
MRIIKPSFEIMDPLSFTDGVDKLRRIEYYARISHRSEEKQTSESWRRFLESIVLQHGDWSVIEHEKATVIFRVDRGITHEIVRHRLFSYTQESTRFVNYGKREIEFIEPVFSSGVDAAPLRWSASMREAEMNYLELLEVKQPPQMARSVLPNATASSIAMTGNLRSWRHFFIMRTTAETHPDLKRVSIPLLEEFKNRIPLLYDDLEPNQKQSISMSRPK